MAQIFHPRTKYFPGRVSWPEPLSWRMYRGCCCTLQIILLHRVMKHASRMFPSAINTTLQAGDRLPLLSYLGREEFVCRYSTDTTA